MRNFRRRALALGTSAVLALAATGLAAGSAFAVGEKRGYTECQANRSVIVTSNTTTAGSPSAFAVGHYVTGGGTFNWSSAGYHQAKHPTPGGTWTISTTGTVGSGGGSCG